MKRIETIEHVEHVYTKYEAIDGTIFNDENECIRYEKTSEAILLSRLNDIQINEINCEDLFESSGEGVYKVIVPTDIGYINTLNQLWKLNGGSSREDLLFNECDINSVILVGIRRCGSKIDWIWFWKFNNVVEEITLGKYKIESND